MYILKGYIKFSVHSMCILDMYLHKCLCSGIHSYIENLNYSFYKAASVHERVAKQIVLGILLPMELSLRAF